MLEDWYPDVSYPRRFVPRRFLPKTFRTTTFRSQTADVSYPTSGRFVPTFFPLEISSYDFSISTGNKSCSALLEERDLKMILVLN